MLPRGAARAGDPPTRAFLLRGFASTVYAWGRGLEGQTGVEGTAAAVAIIPRPTALLDFHGRSIARLSAGRLSSCAITSSGEAYTWGDGRSGLLGHGSGRASLRLMTPQRVEALYGRASVAAAALGDAHALFVSSDGAAFACGENKEGQLGLGTPLEVLAAQHRRALGGGGGGGGSSGPSRLIREAALAAIRGNGRPASSLAQAWTVGGGGPSGGGFGLRRGGGGDGASSSSSSPSPSSLRELLYAGRPSNGPSSSPPFWAAGGGHHHSQPPTFAAPSPLHAGWAGAGASAQRSGNGGSSSTTGGLFPSSAAEAAAMGGGGVGSGWDSGLAPGQVGHPVRVGSDAHALWGDNAADDGDDGDPSSSSSSSFSEQIVAASASRYCSALLTSKGEVWTFGSDFNGALGSAAGATWQPGPRRVDGALGQAIADGGGAVAVATGGGFAAALTREGGVIVWGRLAGEGGDDGLGGGGQQQQQQRRSSSRPARSPRGGALSSPSSPIPARPIPGAAMPAWALGGSSTNTTKNTPNNHRFSAIAAGQRHLLLSDAEGRVWAVGSWLDARGRVAGSAPLVRPKLLLDLGCEGGVSRLAAGPHASAVVSGDGRLYMWGRLLDRAIAEEAWRAAEAAAVVAASRHKSGGLGADDEDDGGGSGAWAVAALQRQRNAADFAWPGFGGDRPRLVPELTGVRDVALGGHHALVLVD